MTLKNLHKMELCYERQKLQTFTQIKYFIG